MMESYEVRIEAEAAGEDPTADGFTLHATLEAFHDGVSSVAVDDEKRLLLSTLALEAVSARDAHDEALEVWEGAWEEAFPDAPASRRLVISAVPAGVRA